jgi:pyrroline-5-carboxylate reductase
MTMELVARRGLHLLGCGRMGSAMLAGWLTRELPPGGVWVDEPSPSPWLRQLQREGLHLNAGVPTAPAVSVVAVKPQIMAQALPSLSALQGGQTLVLSVAAGTPIARYEALLGAETPVVRAMPNTPAAIGRGITAMIGNAAAGAEHLELAEMLLSAVGDVVRVEHEDQMDAVTAVSGSGPAYVFHLIEALAAGGEAQGLAPPLAMQLARATVIGAGALAEQSGESAEQLRINVTSPGGTTAAGLAVLMDDEHGLERLLRDTVAAATARGKELAQ